MFKERKRREKSECPSEKEGLVLSSQKIYASTENRQKSQIKYKTSAGYIREPPRQPGLEETKF